MLNYVIIRILILIISMYAFCRILVGSYVNPRELLITSIIFNYIL